MNVRARRDPPHRRVRQLCAGRLALRRESFMGADRPRVICARGGTSGRGVGPYPDAIRATFSERRRASFGHRHSRGHFVAVAKVCAVPTGSVATVCGVAAGSIAKVNMHIFIDDSAPGGGEGPIVTADLVMHLDAGNSGSYPGTGNDWFNLVASPADGSDQADYDWVRGTGPAFVGTPGGMSAGEYFQWGGTEGFVMSAGTTFTNGMHKAGAAWTLEMWIYTTSTAGGGIRPFFDTGTSDQGGADTSRGVIAIDQGVAQQTAGRHKYRIKRDSGAANAFAVESDAALATNAVLQLAFSCQDGGSSFLYKNGAYDQVSGSDTFTATFSTPGTANPVNAPVIGLRGDLATPVALNSRAYIVRLYNAALTKAQLDQNWEANRGRFGL
jgi:hypothetical protein